MGVGSQASVRGQVQAMVRVVPRVVAGQYRGGREVWGEAPARHGLEHLLAASG